MAENARQAAEWRIIEKAWEDEGVRTELLADPNGVVSRELGVQIPANVTVRVVEEAPDTFVLVLPARPERSPSGRLSSRELESVAGGWDVTGGTCTCEPTYGC